MAKKKTAKKTAKKKTAKKPSAPMLSTGKISENERSKAGVTYFIALLTWLGVVINLVLLLTQEKKVKFHAAQAMLLGVIGGVIGVILGGIVTSMTWGSIMTGTVLFISWVWWVPAIFGISYAIICAYAGIKVWTGTDLKLPWIDNLSESIVKMTEKK